jgi:hypothetical protein
MVLNMFKKKKAPAALPDLAIDSLGFGNSQPQQMQPQLYSQPANLAAQNVQQQPFQAEKQGYKQLTEYKKFMPVQEITAPRQLKKPGEENVLKEIVSTENEEGFFKDLMKNITSEIKDIEKLDKLYKGKVHGEDMVHKMREYWEKQKPELALRNVNNEIVGKLKDKTEKLHALEKEWQEIYINLIEKEEQMRSDEKELKAMLAEFIDVYKKKSPDGKK